MFSYIFQKLKRKKCWDGYYLQVGDKVKYSQSWLGDMDEIQTIIEVKDVPLNWGTSGQWVRTDKKYTWADRAWFIPVTEKY